MISKSEKCPALSGRALLCLFVSGCEELRLIRGNVIACTKIAISCFIFAIRIGIYKYVSRNTNDIITAV